MVGDDELMHQGVDDKMINQNEVFTGSNYSLLEVSTVSPDENHVFPVPCLCGAPVAGLIVAKATLVSTYHQKLFRNDIWQKFLVLSCSLLARW